jgi:hypothetical protein
MEHGEMRRVESLSQKASSKAPLFADFDFAHCE